MLIEDSKSGDLSQNVGLILALLHPLQCPLKDRLKHACEKQKKCNKKVRLFTNKKQATINKRTHKRRKKTGSASKTSPNTKQSIARPPRRVIPECKDHLYILDTEPNASDVVSGRGGKSNHHRGECSYPFFDLLSF